MPEPGNPNDLNGASALEAGIPPQISSVRSFTIDPEPDFVRTSTEPPSPRPLPDRPASSSPPLDSYDDSSDVTWTPPETHISSLPPPRPRPARAEPATTGRPRTGEVNERFPAFGDAANTLIGARLLLLDALHRRPVNDWPTLTVEQHFNSLFSRISPETGHIKTGQDLTRTKVDLSRAMAAGQAFRRQRGLGNAGKAVRLDEPTAGDGTATSPKDAGPKQLLRRKVVARAKQGIATALRFEAEFGMGFLHRQEASTNLRGEDPDRRRGRSRTKQPPRPPGVSREEVALSLSMLRESFPGFYDIVEARHSSIGQDRDDGAPSRAKGLGKGEMEKMPTAGQINGIGLQGTSFSSRPIVRPPSRTSTSDGSMSTPISFGGRQYASLRVVEPTRGSKGQVRIQQPRPAVTARYQPVSRFYEEPDPYSEQAQDSIHPSHGGEYTEKFEVESKTAKVCTAMRKVSSMVKAFAKGVGLRSSSSSSSNKTPKEEKRWARGAESSRNALRDRSRHVDLQGQEEGIRGKGFHSTSSRVELLPSSSLSTPLRDSTSRSNGPGLASSSRPSRYYDSPGIMNAIRSSMERPVTEARLVTVPKPRPRKLKKNPKVGVDSNSTRR